jgi:hypothetical protein
MDELQVIACTNYDDNQLIHRSSPSKLANIWNMMFSPNPRMDDDDVVSGSPHPAIVDTKIPTGVDPNDNATLFSYIKGW